MITREEGEQHMRELKVALAKARSNVEEARGGLGLDSMINELSGGICGAAGDDLLRILDRVTEEGRELQAIEYYNVMTMIDSNHELSDLLRGTHELLGGSKIPEWFDLKVGELMMGWEGG